MGWEEYVRAGRYTLNWDEWGRIWGREGNGRGGEEVLRREIRERWSRVRREWGRDRERGGNGRGFTGWGRE